jgi:hypothetical protein
MIIPEFLNGNTRLTSVSITIILFKENFQAYLH